MNTKTLDHLSVRLSFSVFLTLVCTITFYIYHDFLLLDKLFLFKDIGSDTINVFYPRLVHIADYLRLDGLTAWSFNQGLGQNIFPRSIGNPFEWPLFALGSSQLAYGIVYMEVLKVILGGVFFYLYLRLLLSNIYVCIVGGLLYAFTGFMILGGSWYIFSAQAVYVALMLYAIERYLLYKDWRLIPIGVALIGAGFSFHLYTTAIFFLLYSSFRYIDCNGFQPKALAGFVLRIAAWGGLGVIISTVFIFAAAQEMLLSDRVAGEGSLVETLKSQPFFGTGSEASNVSAVMRAFSSNMLGIGSNYQGAQNYLGDPLFYSGLISLLLAPQVFVFLKRRQRYLYGIFAIIFLLPVIFPYFRYAFWLFSGNYYRILSLFIVLVMMFYSLKALSHIIEKQRLNKLLLAVTLGVLLAALLFPYDFPGSQSDIVTVSTLQWGTAGLLVAYTILLIGLTKEKYRNTAAVLLLAVLCFELIITASMTVNDRPVITDKEMQSRVGYNDFSVDAIQHIRKKDPNFYRIEKTYNSGPANHGSLNDSKVQGYWGTSSYHSFNLGSYTNFLNAMGLISEKSNRLGRRWISGLKQRPILMSFASVKYLLVKEADVLRHYKGKGFRGLGQIGDVTVMENTFVLPFGFTYDSYLPQSEFMPLKSWQKDVMLTKTLIVDKEAEKTLGKHLTLLKDDIGMKFNIQDFSRDIQVRRKQALEIHNFSQNRISGRINADREQFLFFTIPFDKGWHAEIDGKPTELMRVNIGFMGMMVPRGEHSITLSYKPPYFFVTAIISLLGLLIFIVCLWRRSGLDSSVNLSHKPDSVAPQN